MNKNFQKQLKDFQPSLADKVYISPFATKVFLNYLLDNKIIPNFYDTTLQGTIDLRSLQKEDLDSIDQIFYQPFFGNNTDLEALEELCYKHDIALYQLPADHAEAKYMSSYDIYAKHFSQSRDFTFFKSYYPSLTFPIFLQPQFFCPKEEIVNALKDANIDVRLIDLIYKDKDFLQFFDNLSLFGAGECQRSFIGLPNSVSEDDAHRIAKVMLDVMNDHSLRRCSF